MSDRQTAMRNDDLEARIRASLRARADDIDPAPPAWQDLVERSGAVVVPLRPGDTDVPPAHLVPGHRSPRTSRPWLRPVLAAAAALAVVLGATVLVEGRGTNGDTGPGNNEVAVRRVPDSPVIPAPGSGDFSEATATAFPIEPDVAGTVTSADPDKLAAAYLAGVGIDDSQLRSLGYERWIDPASYAPMATPSGPVETATVWWSVRDKADTSFPVTIGPVYMRLTEDGLWTVVAAGTQNNMSLSGVRRADGGVWLTVGDYLEKPYVRVRVDGNAVYEGELGDDYSQSLSPPDPAPEKVITIEVQHLVDGQPVSITAMALAPVMREAVIVNPPTVPATPPVSSP